MSPERVRRAVRRTLRAAQLRRRLRRGGWDPTRALESPDAPIVGVVGPRWMSWVLGPSVRRARRDVVPDLVIVGPSTVFSDPRRLVSRRGWSGAPVVAWSTSGTPSIGDAIAVPVTHANPTSRRVRRHLPPALAEAAREASVASTAMPQSVVGHVDEWLAVVEPARTARRDALRRDSTALVREASRLVGLSPPPADGAVTVICATNRPHNLRRIVENVGRQTWDDISVILVTNSTAFDADEVARAVATMPRGRVVDMPEDRSLGECLNAALDVVDTRFVAKFDDDDHYDEFYLEEMMQALSFSGAAVVGKHSYLAHLAGSDRTVVRFPGHEFRSTSFVAGGTLVVDRSRTGGARFPHRTTGEDSGFLAACEAAGGLVFSTGCLGYVQSRGVENTWTLDEAAFGAGTVAVGSGSPGGCFDACATPSGTE